MYDKTNVWPVSATEIRGNPYKHWEYILGVAREHFVKKVLITGTESCGKTTLTKELAKMFFTSWAREEGRYYSTKYFGGNEQVFEPDDFYNIAWEQRQIDDHAIRTANRIVFIDTDAVVTQYYCAMYMGDKNPKIDTLIDPNRYDKVLMLTPDVRWVADGFRWNSDADKRWRLHEELRDLYVYHGFHDKMVDIGGDYYSRLKESVAIATKILEDVN